MVWVFLEKKYSFCSDFDFVFFRPNQIEERTMLKIVVLNRLLFNILSSFYSNIDKFELC